MKKQICYKSGVLYDGWCGRVKKWYGWVTVIYFDSENEARKWLYNN